MMGEKAHMERRQRLLEPLPHEAWRKRGGGAASPLNPLPPGSTDPITQALQKMQDPKEG